MKRKGFTLVIATALTSSILFSSCIGSFSLTNKLLTWNKEIDTKLVNEIVFLAFHIIPVYEISFLVDIFVINSIEFWTGDNPVADVGTVKTIEGKDGVYTVETKENGYTIQKDGEENNVTLNFDKAEKTWSLEASGESHKLFSFTEGDEVVVYLPNGQEMNVALNEAGILAFQQAINSASYYAVR
ncbi:MAG: DUF3332 domain-containing protein [Tannerellaceae bacterium]|jgi:hypothetical protein|nr:DUF3332 domain-containing protein [Tannerellaceae bacterium]